MLKNSRKYFSVRFCFCSKTSIYCRAFHLPSEDMPIKMDGAVCAGLLEALNGSLSDSWSPNCFVRLTKVRYFICKKFLQSFSLPHTWPSSAFLGQEERYTLRKSPVDHRANTKTHKQCIHNYALIGIFYKVHAEITCEIHPKRTAHLKFKPKTFLLLCSCINIVKIGLFILNYFLPLELSSGFFSFFVFCFDFHTPCKPR